MSFINSLSGFVVDTLLRPFGDPWLALAAAALVTAVLMLLIIRWTSSPAGIRRAKNRLTARVLELVLFRHDALVSFTALGRILAANLFYLGSLLRPLACSAIPCLLILTQLSCWFSARPLRVGETALLEVKLRDGYPVQERPVSLSSSEGVQVETDALRIPLLSEVDWRLLGERDGVAWVDVHAGDEAPLRKQIVVGESLQKVSQRRTGPGLWDQFLHPAEPPIESGHAIAQVRVHYPTRQLFVGNREFDWLLAFLVLTVVFSFALKRPLRVQL